MSKPLSLGYLKGIGPSSVYIGIPVAADAVSANADIDFPDRFPPRTMRSLAIDRWNGIWLFRGL
jgi:hypothetical protein